MNKTINDTISSKHVIQNGVFNKTTVSLNLLITPLRKGNQTEKDITKISESSESKQQKQAYKE